MIVNRTTPHPSNNFEKENNYRSKYGLQPGALELNKQYAIKGPQK